MFERLSFRSQKPYDQGGPFDLGALVEAMIFYGRVELVLNAAGIKQIASAWGPDGLLSVLDSGIADFRYQQNFSGIRTENVGSNRERHSPVVGEVVESEGSQPRPELLIGRVLEEVTGRRGRARRLADQVCRRLTVIRSDDKLPVRVRRDLLEGSFVQNGVRELLLAYVPGFRIPEDMRFEVQEVDDGLRVLTNIDFHHLNTAHDVLIPADSKITPAFLLANFMIAREIMEDAAVRNADIAASPAHAALTSLRIDRLLNRSRAHEASLERFQDFVFDDGRAIREAVNGGAVTAREVIDVVQRAAKLRDWIRNKPADADLVKEYFRAATAETWVDRLPTKTVRWILFSGAGMAIDALGAGGLGTAAGLTLGFGDSFILDRLLQGWKPNQFVDKDLGRLIRREQR